MDPPLKYSRSHKRLNLGIPFFIDNHRFYSWYYIFIPLHIMCCSWSVSLFLLSVFCVFCFLVFAIIWIHACLFERETRSAFSLYTLVLHLYVLSVQPLLSCFQLLFSSISCSELLGFVVRKYCPCCFTLLVLFQIS